MNNSKNIQAIYKTIEELALELELLGEKNSASIIRHRLHAVAWTSSSELLEEIMSVLTNILSTTKARLPGDVLRRTEELRDAIAKHLTSR